MENDRSHWELTFLMAWAASLVLWLFAFSGSLPRLYGAQKTDEISPDRFLNEYRSRLSRFQETYRDVQIDGVYGHSLSRMNSNKSLPELVRPAHPIEFFYVFSDGRQKLKIKRTTPEFYDGALVHADNQQFLVRRASPQAPYFLERVDSTSEPRFNFKEFLVNVRNAPYSPSGFGRFAEYVNSPDFKVREVARSVDGGDSFVRVDFEYLPAKEGTPKRSGGPIYQRLEGRLYLDPSMNWVIRKYDIQARDVFGGGKEVLLHTVGAVQYRQDGVTAIPTVIDYKLTVDEKMIQAWRYEISRFALASTPPEEFTLAAYGLGDFEQPSARTTNRTAYYAMAVGIAALLISLLLSRLARSR